MQREHFTETHSSHITPKAMAPNDHSISILPECVGKQNEQEPSCQLLGSAQEKLWMRWLLFTSQEEGQAYNETHDKAYSEADADSQNPATLAIFLPSLNLLILQK